MTDHLDEHDPLAGRDPYPRHQVDLLPLHDARRELLEEIVSEPGRSAPSRRPALIGAGIAAALAIVAGGAWAVTSGDDDTAEDPVVAASSTPEASDQAAVTDDASEPAPSDDATSPDEADKPLRKDVRHRGVRVGRVISGKECREGLTTKDLRRLTEIDNLDEALRGLRARPRSREDELVYLLRDDKRRIAISADCRVLWLRHGPRGR